MKYCQFCWKSEGDYKDRSSFNHHVKTHNQKTLLCKECEKTFKMKKPLTMHTKNVHGEYIHCQLNQLLRQFAAIRNKERRFFRMIGEYENSLYL